MIKLEGWERLPLVINNKGKCKVKVVKDIRSACSSVSAAASSSSAHSLSCASPPSASIATATAVVEGGEELLREADSFFTCLNFNQESSRLASVQGEIRVGGSFQAKLPPCASSSLSDEPDRDELLYRPDYVCAETEQNYVKLARTFRTFSLMSNKKITMLEKASRSGDLLFDDAVVTLHRCGYNVVEATRMMQAIDQHLTADSSFMSAEDVKKFGKGIKTYGKNFNRISKELLPLHQRDQLVSFYYLWKKSRDATRPKPLRKNAVVAAGRRGAKPLNGVSGMPRNSSSSKTVLASLSTADMELLDYASASETETEQLEGEQRACHHCYSSKSKDWHHAGRDRQLMCTECRLFYKKYGQLRPVERPATVPPCLFKSARQSPTDGMEEQENDEPTGVRTRGAGRKERRRTPSSLEPSPAYGLDMRTPIKAELFENGSGGNSLERRTTPQRSAKANRKRAHRGSNGGLLLEEFSPLCKSKRMKVTESRTPSPLTTNQQQGSEPKDTKACSSSASSTTSSNDNSPQAQVKKEVSEAGSNPLTSTPSDNSSSHNGTPGSNQKQVGKAESKKPIAKVEPLDPNESANRRNSPNDHAVVSPFPHRKSGLAGVVGTATKMLKFEGNNNEKREVEDGQGLQKASTSTSPSNKQEVEESSGEGEGEDNSSLGEVVDLDVVKLPSDASASSQDPKKCLPVVEEVYPYLRRELKRLSGVTCARTDIAHRDEGCRWRRQRDEKKLENERKKLTEQQQKQQQAALVAMSQAQQQQQMMRKPDMNHDFSTSSAGPSSMELALNAAGRLPMNGVATGPAGMLPPPPSGPFPPPNMHAMARMDPNLLAAFNSPQQQQHLQQLMMMAQVEQHQKMEQMQRQQQQQRQQQLNGSIQTGTANTNHHPMGQNKQSMLPQTPITPHMSSPMDPQRNAAAAMSFMNPFNQQQLLEQQAAVAQQQQQQQQQSAMGNPFGMSANTDASQALQSMMSDRAALEQQQQRNSIIERLQMDYINQQQQQQQHQQNQAAAALAAAASNAQQQQAMLMAAAGHPMLAGADAMQVQMFLGLLQQHQMAFQQQQQQQEAAAQQAAAAAAAAQAQQERQRVAAAQAAQQQQQQQQAAAQQQQQQILAMMASSQNLPPHLQQQMSQFVQQQQVNDFLRRFHQEQQQAAAAASALGQSAAGRTN